MYNMDISILGFKFNVEVLILIGVVYLILVGHLFCGCCHIGGLFEGFDVSGNVATKVQEKKSDLKTQLAAGTSGTAATAPSVSTTAKEGFTGANINYGESSKYNIAYSNKVNTASWSQPNMTVVPGQPLDPAVKAFLAREPQPVPLPEGEMLMFANTPFKPECCPNTFSNSSGCACMTGGQYNYLVERGGNNIPYSEY